MSDPMDWAAGKAMEREQRDKRIAEIRDWHEGKRPLLPMVIGESIGLLLSELKLKDAELKSVNELGMKYQEQREKLIEGVQRIVEREYISPERETVTHRLAVSILKSIGIDV